MFTVGDFLDLYVEKYLFEDLDNMAGLTPKKGKQEGAAGYPIVLTVFAGIELLGALVRPAKFDVGDGRKCFRHYWQECMYRPRHRRDIADAIYSLVRNGLAHGFAVKGSIWVCKNQPNRHLTRDDQGRLWIDACELIRDLKDSYTNHVKPSVLNKTSVAYMNMQTRFDEMTKEFTTEVANSWRELGSLQQVASEVGTPVGTGAAFSNGTSSGNLALNHAVTSSFPTNKGNP